MEEDIYRMLYYRLFNRVTQAQELLKQAQQEVEEMFLAAGEMPCAPQNLQLTSDRKK